jgi:hypothetical protein
MLERPHPVGQLLRSGGWAALAAELEAQARLLAVVRAALPEALAAHCRHCVPAADSLLLYVDSPASASPLRFYGPALVAAVAAATGRTFQDFRVRIHREPSPPPRPRRPSATAEASRSVQFGADAATSDEVRNALLRLSRTLAEKPLA